MQIDRVGNLHSSCLNNTQKGGIHNSFRSLAEFRWYSLLSFVRPQLYHSEALPFTYGQCSMLLYSQLTNSVTVFLCFAKVCLSHRSQAGTIPGLGALQHSLWPDVRSNRLAIWTKALWVLCESMNFHPDKQFFQIVGARLWISFKGRSYSAKFLPKINKLKEMSEKLQ